MDLTRLLSDFDIVLAVTFGLALVVAAVEFTWELFTGKMKWPRIKEMLASVSVQIPATLLEGFMLALALGLSYSIYAIVPWKMDIGWGPLVLAIVVADFVHYWAHRWEHEVRLLWTWHSVHHSSPVFNYSTSFRVVFFRSFADAVYYAPLVLLGLHPVLIATAIYFIAVYQIWLHTDLIGKLGPLEAVLNTPSHHRVHHGSDAKYLDKNYGGLLIIWDRMFGTFQAEEEKPTYGLTKPLGTSNPLVVHFHEVGALLRDLNDAKTWSDVKGYLFGPPGWRPEPADAAADR